MISVFLKLENWAGKTLFNTIRRSNNYKPQGPRSKLKETRTLFQPRSVSLACKLDREMRKRLILQETGFTR